MENSNDNTEQQKQEPVVVDERKETKEKNTNLDHQTQEQQNTDTKTEENQVQETQEQINWRKVREKREQDRLAQEEEKKNSQAKDEQIAALTQLVQSISPQQQQKQSGLTQEQQQQAIADLLDEDIPTGGEVKNFLKQYIPTAVNEILTQQSQEQEKKRAEEERKNLGSNLQKKHTDFYNIVSEDNIAYLDYHYPEVSEALTSLPEGVNKWSKIYSTVKKLVPSNSDNSAARIERNMSKPQPGAISSSSPSAEMTMGKSLTQSQKAENYKRLLELARRS